jgi:hypothetical protein
MFIRYTDLGVGHPVTLRRIVRDCSTLESVTTPVEDDSMDVDLDDARSHDEGSRKDDDEQQIDVDFQLDSEGENMQSESEDEDDHGCSGIEGGDWGELAPAVESRSDDSDDSDSPDDDLSF